MNKKFSTLLASALLAVGSFSANAATKPVGSLVLGQNEGLYQLQTADGFLAIENDSLKEMTTANAGAKILNTLWCVTVESTNQGQSVKFEFRNKATGQSLDVSSDYLKGLALTTNSSDLEVGGEIGGWAFSNKINPLETMPIYYYLTPDTVAALNVSANTDGAGNKLVALQKQLTKNDNGYTTTKFTLVEADALTLTAAQINTILGTQDDAKKGVKLTFTPDKNNTSMKNYFTDPSMFLADTTSADGITADPTWVRILTKDSSYVYVDTAYTNKDGVKFLAFNAKDFRAAQFAGKTSQTIADTLGTALNDQSKFTFTYWPSIDSLVIQVKQITNANATTGFFKGEAPVIVTGNEYKTSSATDKKNFVTVQDLVKADQIRIVTIFDKKETEINFGIGGCKEVPSNKRTLEEGLYLIKNKEGKYLAMPIHEDSTYHWVSLEANVEPWDMPSFQWVVEKTRKTSEFSPIKITNREFSNVVTNGMQLYTDADANIFGKDVVIESGFNKATSAIMSNAHLGYRYLNNDSLLVTNYKLQYWTSFATDDLYMGAMKSGDSVVYVGAKDNYVLRATGAEANFGYKGSVEGLAQLKRQAYTMKSKGSDKMIVEAGENRIAVSASAAADTAKFFFKANNNVNGKLYYALIDTAYRLAPDSLRKVGVDENNKYLKRQIMTETRTSAFTVEIDDAPVYRRFNSLALEGNAGDMPDTLRFTEKYRGEFLQMEANPSFIVKGIDFLGIDAVAKGEGKSFFVDTAWVTRGLGYIKPQYLVSIDREAAETTKVKVPCSQCQADIAAGLPAPDNCIHDKWIDVKGYERGKYLVNFVDSMNVKNAAGNNVYTWGKYNRAGFVDALHIGDSLYLLIDKFAGVATDKVNLVADMMAADKTSAKDRNGNGRYIKNLKGDEHKAYTWSFRFFDLAKSAEEVESSRSFLFESLPLNMVDQIQPSSASWLKMQNGCLVMSDPRESVFNEIATGGDDALIFNIEEGSKDDVATDNETVTTSEVSVIAGNGSVRIVNAEGKKVVISNILGQVIVNTVISSSDATIAVPQGVVVVAVEGEEAVKAIVK